MSFGPLKNMKESMGKLTKRDIIKNDESIKLWIQVAEQKQEFYGSTLGTRTWEEYKNCEKFFLKQKLGFAIFGPPSNIDSDENTFYNEPIQIKIIDNIFNVIENVTNSENIYLAFIYVIGNVNGENAEFPIIRILKESDGYIKHTSYFVDILGRTYKNWNEFLEDNNFPKCVYCYPKNGFYSRDKEGNVQLDFGYSPACKKLKRFTKGVDVLSTVAMAGSALIGLTAIAVPIATPVLIGSAVAGVSSGVWTTARNTTDLIDRKQHGQSISLSDQDARIHWFSLVSGILGAAGAGAMHYSQLIARSGQVLSKVPSIIVSAIETGCGISCGSLYFINQIIRLIENKELTSFDSLNFALSILFYYHTKIDTKSINQLLHKLQKDAMIDIRKHLDSEKKSILDYIINEGHKQSSEGGETVKSLRIIKSCDNLEDIFRGDKESTKVKLNVSISTHNNGDWVIVTKN